MIYRLLFLVSTLSMFTFAQTPPIEPGVSQELARWRAARYSDVRYKLNLTLEKMSPVLKGTIEVRVRVGEKGSGGVRESVPPAVAGGAVPIILDWRKIKGFEDRSVVSNVSINGKPALLAASVTTPPAQSGGHPSLDKEGSGASAVTYVEEKEHLIFRDGVVAGENVIKLDFTSPILASGSAITRYVDKEDGSEYIYSLFVPSDASTAFPVFDQPDLKARFDLKVYAPSEWRLVSNTNVMTLLGAQFIEQTKPISTYVFAFAAGPWEKVSTQEAPVTKLVPPALAGGEDAADGEAGAADGRVADRAGRTASLGAIPPANAGGTDKTAVSDTRSSNPVATAPSADKSVDPPTSIYVRKSQAAKFRPHAAEVFRLNREVVKYFEQYFDYKFPFPKYDLVLIPEFPFGGMEHAGATFLRESAVIFPQEPTKNDLVSRATLIFHEAAHQWFGDTVTMRWFDDLWLKEGFATFTAYKALEKIMPEMNAWKVFYERIKQGAYQTDSTRGTTAIYQPIANLSAAKSAYGNIVYNKAPAYLRQAEFYLGEDKFQTAVRAFLKKHEFGNAGWEDLVGEFEAASGQYLKQWARQWVTVPGLPIVRRSRVEIFNCFDLGLVERTTSGEPGTWRMAIQPLVRFENKKTWSGTRYTLNPFPSGGICDGDPFPNVSFAFPNHNDYGYGIFLLDDKSREYVLKNIQNEKDPFLRTMMWGSLWDSVREGELDPRVFVDLVVKVLGKSYAFTRETNAAKVTSGPVSGAAIRVKTDGVKPQAAFTPEGVTLTEEDESTIAALLGRTGTALNYYIDTVQRPAREQGLNAQRPDQALAHVRASSKDDLRGRVEELLIERMRNAPSLGQRITYYRAFLNIAASEKARGVLKSLLATGGNLSGSEGVSSPASKRDTLPTGRVSASAPAAGIPLKTKDKFDIVTRLLILDDPEAPKLLAELEKTETSDDAKRYAYAARAGIGTVENKAKYWNDFVSNKEISESWIEAAFGPWNSIRHSDLTLPYLERALKELPNHKRNRKIFFVNGWLGAFLSGQRSGEALAVVNKFLADNPGLDNDLRLKILENVDLIERAVNIRRKFPQV